MVMHHSLTPRIIVTLSACMFCGSLWAQLAIYKDDVNDPNVAVIEQIDTATGQGTVPTIYATCTGTPANTVFGVGFTSGYAYIGSTLYGLEWGSNGIYLYTLAGSFCATGTRIGTQPVGFSNLESLAYCSSSGRLYSTEFDFSSHSGRLVQIDPATGQGIVVGGLGISDLRVTGLACTSAGQLYGVTSGYGTRSPELVTLDRGSGSASIVGRTGTEALESLALKGAQLYAAGRALYALDSQTAAATLVAPVSTGTAWAMAASDGPGSPCTAGVTAVPAAPVMNLVVEGQQATATWPAVAAAQSYRLFFAPYSNPISSVTLDNIQSRDLGAQTSVGGTLEFGTKLYVAIQAYNCSGGSGYSNIGVVTIEP